MTGQNRFPPPKRKAEPLDAHDMQAGICRRCRLPMWRIVGDKLACISEVRAAGDAAIRGIVK